MMLTSITFLLYGCEGKEAKDMDVVLDDIETPLLKVGAFKSCNPISHRLSLWLVADGVSSSRLVRFMVQVQEVHFDKEQDGME